MNSTVEKIFVASHRLIIKNHIDFSCDEILEEIYHFAGKIGNQVRFAEVGEEEEGDRIIKMRSFLDYQISYGEDITISFGEYKITRTDD